MFRQFYFLQNEADVSFGDAPAAPAAAAPAQPDAPAAPAFAYPETLAAEFRQDTTFKKFAKEDGSFDFGKVMQSYAQLEKHLGSDKIAVPGKTATDADWKNVFAKLGLPESADKYELTAKLPEGYTADDTLISKFKEAAHAAGVLPKQAQQLLDFYNSYSIEAMTAMDTESAARRETELGNLKKEWGGDYTARISSANAALHQFASPEEVAAMKEAGMLNAQFLKVFDKISKALADDTFTPVGGGAGGSSIEEMKKELAGFYEKGSPLYSTTHPLYAQTQDRVHKLLQAIHGTDKIK